MERMLLTREVRIWKLFEDMIPISFPINQEVAGQPNQYWPDKNVLPSL
jgi:hypothetical protein